MLGPQPHGVIAKCPLRRNVAGSFFQVKDWDWGLA